MFGLIREDELQDNYEAIVRESERLTWLVDNVLDYAAIERDNKSFVLREVDLNAVIQRVVDSLQVTLTMRDMEFELEIGSRVADDAFGCECSQSMCDQLTFQCGKVFT